MSTDRKLAWAGVVLALPGLVALFRDENYKISVLVLLLLIAVVAGLLLVRRATTRPQISVKKLTKTLVIDDAAGTLATLNRTQEFVTNYQHIQKIWFRNIVADGLITNPLIDGKPPTHSEKMGCLLSVARDYRGPLEQGKVHTVTLTYGLERSFPSSNEALLHDVDSDTKLLILEVRLPQARVCKQATLFLVAAGEPMHPLPGKVSVSTDGTQIRAEIKHPLPGYTYDLSWEW